MPVSVEEFKASQENRELRPLNDRDRKYMQRLAARGVNAASIMRHMNRLNIRVTPYDVSRLGYMHRGNGSMISCTYRMPEETYVGLRLLAKSLGYEWPRRKGVGTTGALPPFFAALVQGKIKLIVNDGPEPEKYYSQADYFEESPEPEDYVLDDQETLSKPEHHLPDINWYQEKEEELGD